MRLDIIQDDTDCIDYCADVTAFIKQRLGEKPTQEQVDSRFDVLLTEYAMRQASKGYTASYDAATRKLTIMS